MIGTFCLNSCPDITSIISKYLDFIIIDREHGRASLDNALSLLNSANDNCEKFIRVSSCNRIEIQRVLEIKPDGILVPQISSIEDAKKCYRFYILSSYWD
jgi:2-keto-3-deoxy-L-rhamnonate aldolase RhmA